MAQSNKESSRQELQLSSPPVDVTDDTTIAYPLTYVFGKMHAHINMGRSEAVSDSCKLFFPETQETLQSLFNKKLIPLPSTKGEIRSMAPQVREYLNNIYITNKAPLMPQTLFAVLEYIPPDTNTGFGCYHYYKVYANAISAHSPLFRWEVLHARTIPICDTPAFRELFEFGRTLYVVSNNVPIYPDRAFGAKWAYAYSIKHVLDEVAKGVTDRVFKVMLFSTTQSTLGHITGINHFPMSVSAYNKTLKDPAKRAALESVYVSTQSPLSREWLLIGRASFDHEFHSRNRSEDSPIRSYTYQDNARRTALPLDVCTRGVFADLFGQKVQSLYFARNMAVNNMAVNNIEPVE